MGIGRVGLCGRQRITRIISRVAPSVLRGLTARGSPSTFVPNSKASCRLSHPAGVGCVSFLRSPVIGPTNYSDQSTPIHRAHKEGVPANPYTLVRKALCTTPAHAWGDRCVAAEGCRAAGSRETSAPISV